jgi:hypothetical protein
MISIGRAMRQTGYATHLDYERLGIEIEEVRVEVPVGRVAHRETVPGALLRREPHRTVYDHVPVLPHAPVGISSGILAQQAVHLEREALKGILLIGALEEVVEVRDAVHSVGEVRRVVERETHLALRLAYCSAFARLEDYLRVFFVGPNDEVRLVGLGLHEPRQAVGVADLWE